MAKRFLACSECGHVQAVKSDEMWGCGKCGKVQLVDEGAVRQRNESGGVLRTCSECGHVQAVRVDIWMCYKCRKMQPASRAAARRAAAK